MNGLLLNLAIAVVVGLLSGFFTYRSAGRRGIEEDPRIIGILAGVIGAVGYIIVVYVFW